MQVEYKPLEQVSNEVVALPPEEEMNLDRTHNIILKRKNPNNELANIKKIKNETDLRVRDVVKHPIQRKLEKKIKKTAEILIGKSTSGMIKSGLASVDISTMKRLPWIDFDTILENTEAEKREKVILDILQNNLPDSANDIYYIYHDENTNTYSIEVEITKFHRQYFANKCKAESRRSV